MDNFLTDEEAKFCLLFVNGTDAGNARKCYMDVFNENDEAVAQYNARKILAKEVVKERIKELRNVELYTAESLRPRITETLLGIMGECANSEYTDKNGNLIQPAAMRAVSVHAAKTLNEMYGIKEDIAHKVAVEVGGESGGGVTFNVVMPQPRDQKEEDLLK